MKLLLTFSAVAVVFVSANYGNNYYEEGYDAIGEPEEEFAKCHRLKRFTVTSQVNSKVPSVDYSQAPSFKYLESEKNKHSYAIVECPRGGLYALIGEKKGFTSDPTLIPDAVLLAVGDNISHYFKCNHHGKVHGRDVVIHAKKSIRRFTCFKVDATLLDALQKKGFAKPFDNK
ncbi:unnamed protein product [Caenorhabditis auriculariae]|uniref:Uncharacterized protein n=1 Tax=Caenorhabditis auriculariae TaxID=2777116 RepID=A0A8S1GRY7_9PELO|nr:unnamed protein product [Caenorhabditis auriculariae]